MSIFDIFGTTEAPQKEGDIRQFVASVKKEGLALSNRFSARVGLPKTLQGRGYTPETSKKLFLYCDTATLPGIAYSTTAARTYGEIREMPYERTFDPVVLTFYIDNSFIVKGFFEDWQNSIQNNVTREIQFYDNYTTLVDIFVYDVANNSRYLCRLHEAYPKIVAPIQLDYASKDVMKLNVTMQYKYWTSQAFAAPASKQRGWISTIFGDAVEDAVGSITNSLPIPSDYFSNFNQFQETYNDLSNGNNIGNAFNNVINNPTPAILNTQPTFTNETLAQVAGSTFRVI